MSIKPEQLNASIRTIPLPDLMRDLPVSRQGYPVPFFAAKVDGEWDFRVVRPDTTVRCVREKLCWICGKRMGSKKAFVVGPMCVVTRTSAEPPSHYSCGVYAAIACPFLASPRMKRNEADLPAGHTPPSGIALMRNPGCAAVLITRSYRPFNDGKGGMLIEMGKPESVEWYAKRGRATYTDVMESIESGLGALQEQCDNEATPFLQEEARQELAVRVANVMKYLPAPTLAEVTVLNTATLSPASPPVVE
jgi:hypothetical protein